MTNSPSQSDSKWLRHLEMSEGRFDYKGTISYRYHEFTKHTVEGLYSSSHRLDWALQTDPFRQYEGSSSVELPVEMHVNHLGLFETINRMHLADTRSDTRLSEGEKPDELNLCSLSSLLYFSMSISAWKQIKGTEEKWALRVNPSSGNLHPTEAHILLGEMPGIEAGAYHYCVKDHHLEKRANKNILDLIWAALERSDEAPPLMLVLSSIFWREAWKYRDRAYRYCQLDLGHAAAAISLAAANLGWYAQLMAEFPDREISSCLGLDMDNDEKPMLLIAIYPDWKNTVEVSPGIPSASSPASCEIHDSSSRSTPEIASPTSTRFACMGPHYEASCVPPAASKQDSATLIFTGHPNVLSSYVLKYASINSVYQAGCITQEEYRQRQSRSIEFKKPELHPGLETIELAGRSYKLKSDPSFHQTVRKRRSAVDMDGQARSSLARLSKILIDSTGGCDSSFLSLLRSSAPDPFGTSSPLTKASNGSALDQLESMPPEIHIVNSNPVKNESDPKPAGAPASPLQPALAALRVPMTRLAASSRLLKTPQYYIHILIYAHRIDGLAPGVYYFDREELTLSLLHDGNVRTHAKFVSCLQDIASDGIFAVSLLADMQSAFEHFGQRAYRYVHQEAGFIGQLFYLSARALDIDATGIGCFIDDEINNGLPQGMEVVYNFTFGKAVPDTRLSNLPAYDFADPSFAAGDEPLS